ncbi:DUF84 family protein [Lentibacillus sp. Marseille-P4043]|uniref:DUF84 family protein n=1 Tax=Lentibacillus sp. Marseille-P4043 TaxID=2040293 RepID=UPI000D0B303D|nr:DUF84 family protein [Lentibacillus sp. Marseille-P4043]
MKISVGSKNPTKMNAVEEVFPTDSIVTISASSSVSAQPFSDEETKEGAINRAMECVKKNPDAIGIGLEGGVMYVDDQLYLCNWGALVDQEKNIYTASGARIPLPEEINAQLTKGHELGDVMDGFAMKQEVRKNEGAIGIFTNELITRKEMFTHVVKLLRGQWEFNNRF